MKFRRKSSEQPGTGDGGAAGEAGEQAEAPAAVDETRANGPWDESEVELVEGAPGQLDLGSLVVTMREGLDLQLQVDERSGQVVAAVLAGKEGAVEMRVFAAPRNGDIWPDVRQEIAAEVTRRGGTVSENEGRWGTELRVLLSVTTEDGRTGTQPSRVFGIAGPRWLLRATMFGKPALEPEDDGLIESALRDVVVRRGPGAHAPGEALPMRVPSGQGIDHQH